MLTVTKQTLLQNNEVYGSAEPLRAPPPADRGVASAFTDSHVGCRCSARIIDSFVFFCIDQCRHLNSGLALVSDPDHTLDSAPEPALVFDFSPVFNFGSGFVFDSDSGLVLNSTPCLTLNSDSTIISPFGIRILQIHKGGDGSDARRPSAPICMSARTRHSLLVAGWKDEQVLTYSSDFGAARLDPCELRTVVPYIYMLSERWAELGVGGVRFYFRCEFFDSVAALKARGKSLQYLKTKKKRVVSWDTSSVVQQNPYLLQARRKELRSKK
ncbi:hypothetical protein EVAR_99944_1 [Eumeta japonica]|uniref:Uncharacterized protein n=1 Tax=Eumeta variegata TaxID=151549 RepID=A0A4C1ZIF7_EUMVA|nr:hypothetical protein EVAR_99944_1 [Eumeta japonica]